MSDIKTTNGYSEQYFVNLMDMVLRRGTIYVVDDGNHYADEQSAVDRCRDTMKLRSIKRYATVTMDNFPKDHKVLEALFRTVDAAPAPVEEVKAPEKAYDLSAARAKLQELREGTKGRKTKE